MTDARPLRAALPPSPARTRSGMTRIDPDAPLLRRWMERIRCRRELRDLALTQPDSVLRDAGLCRQAVLRESAKPFWRA